MTWMYILQLNYWRGPIDAWLLLQNIGGIPPGSTPLHRSIIIVSYVCYATRLQLLFILSAQDVKHIGDGVARRDWAMASGGPCYTPCTARMGPVGCKYHFSCIQLIDVTVQLLSTNEQLVWILVLIFTWILLYLSVCLSVCLSLYICSACVANKLHH